jgi:hypothetical protein
VLQSVGAVSHSPAFQVSRRLGISPRALGRITGPLFVNVKSSSSASGGGGRSDRGERVDVGLCVKHGGRKLCVPDYVCPAPDDRGWLYSPALGEFFLVCFLFFSGRERERDRERKIGRERQRKKEREREGKKEERKEREGAARAKKREKNSPRPRDKKNQNSKH